MKVSNQRKEKYLNTILWWLNVALLEYVSSVGIASSYRKFTSLIIFISEIFLAYLITIAMVSATRSLLSRSLMALAILGVLIFVLTSHSIGI